VGIGKNHFDLGQFEEAIHRLDEVLAKYPDSDSPGKPFVFVP
jgi:Flp pilus assembly protein TadD